MASGLFATVAVRHASALEVDDGNTANSESYTVSDARLGFLWSCGRFELQPFGGVRNWSGAEYDGTIRPNAGFGRYFEPAPDTELYGGLELRLR